MSAAGLAIALAGTRAVCRPAGSLWIEAHAALIVADLHFEKGSAYASRGQMLPPFDTRETLARLEAEVAALDPATIVFLGDSFHDSGAESRLAPDDARRLDALAASRRLVWITGNHDGEGPRRQAGDCVAALTLGGLRLVHEPAASPSAGEVAGHLHPCARVSAPGGSVRRRCFVTDGERLVMPAFGALTGGLNVRHRAFAPLFRHKPIAAVLGKARVHAVGWGSLRDD